MDAGGLDWSDDRMRSVYLEARSVVEAQNETMADIDTEAMQTVRFDVLIVGVLLTAAQITGAGTLANADVFDPALLHVSILSLLASVVLGVVTSNESDLYVGLDGRYVETLAREDIGDDRWDRHVVRTFAGVIAENGLRSGKGRRLLSRVLGRVDEDDDEEGSANPRSSTLREVVSGLRVRASTPAPCLPRCASLRGAPRPSGS